MKNKSKKISSPFSKWIHLALLIVVLGFIYFFPMWLYQYRITNWIPFPLIVFVIPVLITKTFNRFKLGIGLVLGLLSVFIIGPTYGLFQDYRARKEVKENGIWAKSVVIDRRYRKHSWDIQCRFKANSRSYETYYITDYDNRMLGDTLSVIYSKKFPGINYLKYEWEED